jgi:nucleoside phosphorylase
LVRLDACRFGIVTALPKEFAAMRALLDEPCEWPAANDPNDYVIGTIPARDGSGHHAVVLTLLKSPRNNSAAAAVTHLVRSVPSVTEILMVGIAGGIPNPQKAGDHVRLGDVVVTDKEGVRQYDNLQLVIDSIKILTSAAITSALLVGRANLLMADSYEGKVPWLPYIADAQKILPHSTRPGPDKDKLAVWADGPTTIEHPVDQTRRPGEPKIHLGRIGASNTLLKKPHTARFIER